MSAVTDVDDCSVTKIELAEDGSLLLYISGPRTAMRLILPPAQVEQFYQRLGQARRHVSGTSGVCPNCGKERLIVYSPTQHMCWGCGTLYP